MKPLVPQDIEAERATLGSILIDNQVFDEVRDMIPAPEFFWDHRHATVYQAIIALRESGKPADPVTLTGKLLDMGVYNSIGWGEYQFEVLNCVPNAVTFQHYAERVADMALRRRAIEHHEQVIKSLHDGHNDASSIIDSAVNRLIELRPPDRNTEGKLDDWLGEALKDDKPRVQSGMYALDDIVRGFEMGTMTIVGARPSMGKAQPLDAKVLTEVGFARMGDIRVGDRLASIDGEMSIVTGVFPQGEREVNRITFSDGRSTECCDEHLWSVMYRDWDAPKVVTTARLREMIGKKRYRNRLYIETYCGDFGIERMMPIDPWLLGFLIGDGCLTNGLVRFSTSCESTVDTVREKVGSVYRVEQESKYNYRITIGRTGGKPNPLMLAMESLGLRGKRSYEKHIPSMYLEATREVRSALLAGLMDSDGWVEKGGSMFYGTTSEILSRDIAELVRSLGGYCRVKTKDPRYTYKGEVRDGRKFYILSIQIDKPRLYCNCPAKLARLPEDNGRSRRLNVVSIVKSRTTQTQCISVSHPSSLYVTDDFIVTHNTAWGVCFALNVASDGVPAGFFSAEMKARRIARRLACAEARISTDQFEQDKHKPAMLSIIEDLGKLPLWIDETPGAHVDKVCSRIRRWHREHGIQVAIVDYLQLLSHGMESEYEGVTYISRQLKSLAGELDIALFVLAQLNRGNTQRTDKKPTMADLRGSGAIEQDADQILMLHRESYYRKDEDALNPLESINDNEAEIMVEKSRDGQTGIARVGWIGHCGVFASGG